MQLTNFNPYTDRDTKDCQVCNYFPDIPSPINITRTNNNIVKTNPICNSNGCSTKWIDTAMLEYKFGIDYCNGISMSRWFPGWLIDYCPTITRPTDLGYPDPCHKDLYYKIAQDGFVYAVQYDCNGKQIGPSKQLKSWQIQDCAIAGIDASKIINPCKIFTSSKLAKPMSDYTVSRNGVDTIDPNIHFLDVVITDNCILKAAYLDKIARQAVLPSISCLINYDVANDVAKVDLSKVIDAKTIRVTQATGNCDKLYSYTYVQDNILGDGTDINPLIARVKTDGYTITGDGTSTNPLKGKVVVDNITVFGDGTLSAPLKAKTYANPNQFSGDGQSPASQYSLKTCSLTPSYIKLPSFTYLNTTTIRGNQFTLSKTTAQTQNFQRIGSRVWEYKFVLPISLPANPCGGKWRCMFNMHANYQFDETDSSWDSNEKSKSIVAILTPEINSMYLPGTNTPAASYIQNIRFHGTTDFTREEGGDINICSVVDVDPSLTQIECFIAFSLPESVTPNATNMGTGEHMATLTVLSST